MEEYPRDSAPYLDLDSSSSDLSLRGNAADFGTVDPAGLKSFMAPLTPDGVHWEQAGSSQSSEKAGGASEKKPFYKRRWFIVSQVIACFVGIGFLFVLLFPVVKAIAQHIVNVSKLNVDRVMISEPTNTSFSLRMDGWISHAGIFSAQISFTQPLYVSWVNASEEVPLGIFNLEPLYVKKKRAYINQTADFTITDQSAFGRFTQYMITSNNFTWRLRSGDLHVRALKFPVSKGVGFKKDLHLSGINNFEGNVVLKEFQLPSDSPEGGINFWTVTTLINPSPFQLNLSTVVFNLLYGNVYLGQGTGTNTTIVPGPNDIALSG